MTEIDSSKAGNIMFMLNSPQKIFIIENRPKSGSSNNIPQNRIKISNPKQPKSGKIVICRVENDCIISVHKPVHISSTGKTDTPISDATVIEDFKLIEWASENNIDFIVFKQIRNKEDLDFLLSLSSLSAKKILGVQNKSCLNMFEDVTNIMLLSVAEGLWP